jgi:hypothetical protein
MVDLNNQKKSIYYYKYLKYKKKYIALAKKGGSIYSNWNTQEEDITGKEDLHMDDDDSPMDDSDNSHIGNTFNGLLLAADAPYNHEAMYGFKQLSYLTNINELKDYNEFKEYTKEENLLFIKYKDNEEISNYFKNTFLISCHGSILTNREYYKIIIPYFIDMYFDVEDSKTCIVPRNEDDPSNFYTCNLDDDLFIQNFIDVSNYDKKIVKWRNKKSAGDIINDCYLEGEFNDGIMNSVTFGVKDKYYQLHLFPENEGCLLSSILLIIIAFIDKHFINEVQQGIKFKIFCSFCLDEYNSFNQEYKNIQNNVKRISDPLNTDKQKDGLLIKRHNIFHQPTDENIYELFSKRFLL